MFPWLSFLSYIIIVAYTPGPNNIMSMNNAKNVGFKKGMVFNFGIFAGFLAATTLCLIFSSVLYTLIPKIQLPMKILGASYMVYLIIKTIVPQKESKVKNNNGSFLIGALLQLINPKLMLYGITAMSSFILPHYNKMPILLLFVLLLSFVGFTGTVCWALFGSLFSKLFSKYGTLLNIIMSLLLLYCIVSLFI
jgi:threonine/homoserine/homoserine lactone efflux protein